METRSIAELTDVSEVIQCFSQVVTLTLLQYLRNQEEAQSYQQIANVLKIHPMAVKFVVERLAQIGVLTVHDTSTFTNPDSGLACIAEDIPPFANSILQSIWPYWQK